MREIFPGGDEEPEQSYQRVLLPTGTVQEVQHETPTYWHWSSGGIDIVAFIRLVVVSTCALSQSLRA